MIEGGRGRSCAVRAPACWENPPIDAALTIFDVLDRPPAVVLAVACGVAGVLAFAGGLVARGVSRGAWRRLAARVSPPAGVAVVAAVGLGVMQALNRDQGRVLVTLAVDAAIAQGLLVALLVAATAVIARLIGAGLEIALERHDVTAADNYLARRVHTQWRVIGRIASVLVWVVGISAALMTFEAVASFGRGLLASAGIGALVVGLAAQRSLGNFIAGVQIALTQPIRLDDVVIVEGEWGRVEEIATTYVVLRLWDERRLVVPFSTLLEKPFQNWTRTRADIIGSVFLHVDYGVDLDALRHALRDACEASGGLWDGRVRVLQVTDANRQGLELRALVSAADAARAWDLRCLVRERLVAWLREHQPHALPRTRVELDGQRPGGPARQPPEGAGP